jgi:hypothetical protein
MSIESAKIDEDNRIDDEQEAGWDVAGAYESNNSGLTSDPAINEALHNFQAKSDFLLEKYVQKVKYERFLDLEKENRLFIDLVRVAILCSLTPVSRELPSSATTSRFFLKISQ